MIHRLTFLQRKLLKYIVKNPGVLIEQLEKSFKLPEYELISNLELLQHFEYIDRACDFKNFVYPTLDGKSFFELETQENVEICIKSILCPLVVAFATSVITTIITLMSVS